MVGVVTVEPRGELQSVDDVVDALHREQAVGLVRFAALVLHDVAEAEDVVQEAFLRARSAWARSGCPDVPAAYVRRTVANLCNSRLRRAAVARRLHVAPRPAVPTPEEAAVVRDDQRAVLAALDRLSVRQRTCLCLRYYLDLTDVEVADALGISLGSAKTHLRRGLDALGRTLEDRR